MELRSNFNTGYLFIREENIQSVVSFYLLYQLSYLPIFKNL